eukprot:scaffold667361_cov66-Prasinocladus_malaysianus.AAC.1
MREIDTTHEGRLYKPEFVAILMDSYSEDSLQQYDDRLYHDPAYSNSFSLSIEHLWRYSRDGDGEMSYSLDGKH